MYVGPSESVLPRNRAGYRVGGIGHMRGGSYPPKPLRKKLERCSQLDALGSHCTRRPCLDAPTTRYPIFSLSVCSAGAMKWDTGRIRYQTFRVASRNVGRPMNKSHIEYALSVVSGLGERHHAQTDRARGLWSLLNHHH